MKIYKVMLTILLVVFVIGGCAKAPAATPVVPAVVETNEPAKAATEKAPEVATEVAAPQEKVELVIWNTWADFHVTEFQKILDEFNATHEFIKVTQQPQPYADFEAKLMQAVRAGTGPDLISAFPTIAANYIDEGLIVDLSNYINDPVIGIPGFKESLSDGVYKEITQWGGDVYMIPSSVGGEVFIYNKTLYDSLGLSIPKTWAELEANSRTITASTGKPAFGFDNEIDGFQVLISQNGSGYINPETNMVEYNNPEAVKQLEWFCGLVNEGVFRLVGEDVYFSNPFGSQAVASYIGAPAGYGFIKSAVNDQFVFDVAPIPQGGTNNYVSSWGGSYIIFTSTEARQKAAFEFVKYMISPEVLGNWSTKFGVVPAYQAAIDQPVYQEYLATNPAVKASSEQMQYTGFLSATKGSAAIRTIIGRAVNSACSGLKTPAEALQIAEQEGNAELAANQ